MIDASISEAKVEFYLENNILLLYVANICQTADVDMLTCSYKTS